MKYRMVGNQILCGGLSPEDRKIFERRKRRLEEARKIYMEDFKKIREECWEKFHGE